VQIVGLINYISRSIARYNNENKRKRLIYNLSNFTVNQNC